MRAEAGPARTEWFLNTSLYHRRKLRVAHSTMWEHHRGGWIDVTRFLERQLSCPDGVLTINALEETIASGRVLSAPWVAFSHEVPYHGYAFPDLARLQQLPAWKASVNKCQGLWVLSTYNKQYWESCSLPFPISFIHYPTASPRATFSIETFANQVSRPLLFIGEYLRLRQPFFDLVAPAYTKLQLNNPGFRWKDQPTPGRQPVTVVDRVSDDEYDRLLTRSVVFLHLRDAGANTTIVECIARGTPVVVNRVGGVAEYLGDGYPLFYESLEEASAKLANFDLIEDASRYLLKAPVRERLSFDDFKQQLQNTAVYRSLPIPTSQRSQFPRFDLTVLICTFKRIDCLPGQLERLSRQEFDRTFEVLIWNNNADAQTQVNEIVRQFSEALAIRTLHSSDNLFAAIRFAVPALMRSEVLMICDDDVLPEPGYLKAFWEKHKLYGPRSVICARGHTFLPHELDTDQPDRAWREQDLILFHDQSEADREIHYLHADNCMITRALLREATLVDMAVPEYILVDDYWLSYALSRFCDCSIWKIKCDDVLRFHPLADDARIALFQNSRVREERVNFYIYHMRQGWPFSPVPACEAPAPPAVAHG